MFELREFLPAILGGVFGLAMTIGSKIKAGGRVTVAFVAGFALQLSAVIVFSAVLCRMLGITDPLSCCAVAAALTSVSDQAIDIARRRGLAWLSQTGPAPALTREQLEELLRRHDPNAAQGAAPAPAAPPAASPEKEA